jgi:hypothetical protein
MANAAARSDFSDTRVRSRPQQFATDLIETQLNPQLSRRSADKATEMLL